MIELRADRLTKAAFPHVSDTIGEWGEFVFHPSCVMEGENSVKVGDMWGFSLIVYLFMLSTGVPYAFGQAPRQTKTH